MVNGLESIKNVVDIDRIACETCAKGKICVKPFPKMAENRADKVLGLVHSDICGPMNKVSAGGARYFLTFIDDYSRYMFVNFLKTRDELLPTFKNFVAFAEKQTGEKFKAIRSDNGRESYILWLISTSFRSSYLKTVSSGNLQYRTLRSKTGLLSALTGRLWKWQGA